MAKITTDEAAHLYRRMAFGGSQAEVAELALKERDAAVDFFLNYSQIGNSSMENLLQTSFDFSNPDDFPKFNRAEIQRWWFTRMVHTSRQFEEKMTLFWHNHFATAASKVPEIFMFIQNQTLRARALDRFDLLLGGIAKDPAMLIWLDGITNVRGRPNENWARELQELFTMGIKDVVTGEPNYDERDVQEIARAFTGWKFFGPSRTDPDRYNYRFFINPNEFDNTPKTVYGQIANFTGEEIITLVSARRATARFLVTKLFEFFVYPLGSSAADKATIEKFADVYMSSNHSIRELVRAIFVSDEFFSERARFALVKSPVDLIVGSIRMLGARYNPGSVARRDQSSNILAQVSTFLGQELFNPYDVAGWKLNLGWINTSSLLNRFTFADLLVIGRTRDINAPGLWLSGEDLRSLTKKNTKKTVKKLLSTLGPLQVDADTTRSLRDYLEKDDQGNIVGFTKNDATMDKKVRGLIHLIMCLSEFQLS
jgi:uncharacterized protein (DUF1800 family)